MVQGILFGIFSGYPGKILMDVLENYSRGLFGNIVHVLRISTHSTGGG